MWLSLWIVLRLEMGLSKTTISRLHFSPCASIFWYLGTRYGLFWFVSLSFFWTEVHESSGVFLHWRASTSLVCSLWTCDGTSLGIPWCDGPTQVVVWQWSQYENLCLLFFWFHPYERNIGRWCWHVANVRFVSNGTNELPRRWQGKRFGQLHGGIDPHPIGNDHNINLGTSKDIELHYIFSKIFHNLDCLKLSAVIDTVNRIHIKFISPSAHVSLNWDFTS